MQDLLGQVRQAIAFAENVTTAVADAYQQADQDAAAGYTNVTAVSPSVIQGG